ncbi:MAG: Coq4 family protein [Bacteriovoracia bacterium]
MQLASAKLLKGYFGLVEDPENTESVFEMTHAILSGDGALVKVRESLRSFLEAQKEFMELFKNGYAPPLANLDELAGYPKDSLGFAFYQHMKKAKLDVEFFPEIQHDNVLMYFFSRLRHTHDIIHAALGYDTSLEGEFAVQGYVLAQTQVATSAMIISSVLFHLSVAEPTRLKSVFEACMEGYERGKKGKFIFSLKWEDLFKQPLEEVRKIAGI